MSERSQAKGWTLRERILQWLVMTSAGLALGLSAAGVWFVSQAAGQAVDALLHEELDEVKAAFLLSEIEETDLEEAFAEIALELRESHPGTTFAWRLWLPSGEVAREYGALEALEEAAPARWPLDESVQAEGGFRWRSTELHSGHVLGLILDESSHFALVRQFGGVSLAFLLVGFAAIFFVGLSFANRVSRMLSQIASEARKAGGDEGVELSRTELPEELADVVDALDASLRQIREETQASRILIAGMAHELRAPLQNLIGETEVTLLSERDPERYQDVLTSHLDELRDLAGAVQNLVSLCSAKRAAAAEVLEDFELESELGFRLNGERQRAVREGITLSFHSSGGTNICGDREALMTGIRNLISNALDWTPSGGEIEVSCEGTEDAVDVFVRDSGPGIAPGQEERIFEPFVRGESANGRRIGYGLGLALARSAAESQGGSIAVVRDDRPGASFRLHLPRQRALAS